MIDGLALKRRREPEPGGGALFFFSLIAAAGFAVGWVTQGISGF